jgi:hypothetical protein
VLHHVGFFLFFSYVRAARPALAAKATAQETESFFPMKGDTP